MSCPKLPSWLVAEPGVWPGGAVRTVGSPVSCTSDTVLICLHPIVHSFICLTDLVVHLQPFGGGYSGKATGRLGVCLSSCSLSVPLLLGSRDCRPLPTSAFASLSSKVQLGRGSRLFLFCDPHAVDRSPEYMRNGKDSTQRRLPSHRRGWMTCEPFSG